MRKLDNQIFGKRPSRPEKHLGHFGNHTDKASAIMELLSKVREEINDTRPLVDLI